MNQHSRLQPQRPAPTRARIVAFAVVGLLALASAQLQICAAAERAVKIPPLTGEATSEAKAARETVVFAGGCFWGVQGVFQHTKGVLNAVSGYAGGSKSTAIYELVGSGMTGHAEAVQVSYDPKQVSYAQLLQIYFSVAHDPTQLNHQYPDSGTQYRSAIFTTSASQKMVADKYIAQLDAAKVFPAKIVTQVGPLMNGFFPAEAYHQDYATLHPDSGYISHYDLPKIANLKTTFPQFWRDQPVLVNAKG
jgi:peptide-methionine (S)-S-oxide reductase